MKGPSAPQLAPVWQEGSRYLQAPSQRTERPKPLAMTPFRLPVVQRTVALLLFAGAGIACAPAASASATAETALEVELRTVLGDSEAVELAIQAARKAPTHEAAIEAFMDAYVSATGDREAARDISRLLQDHPNRFGAPALPPSHAVWTVASSTAQLLQRTALAGLTHDPPAYHGLAVATVSPDRQPAQPGTFILLTQQPRGP